MKNSVKSGDIFTQKLDNGKHMFGRVLMDIKKQCFDSKIIANKADSLLRQYTPGYVIEVYDTISSNSSLPENSNVIIPGIAVDSDAIENDEWKIIGYKAIDVKEIDFQESLNFYDGELDFQRGEVFISVNVPKKLLNEEIESFNSSALVNSYLILEDIFEYLESNDKTELLDYDMRLLSKQSRDRVYKIIDENPEMSYYDLALKHGFDTRRFFESSHQTTIQTKEKDSQTHILQGVNWSFTGKPFENMVDFETALKQQQIALSNHELFTFNKVIILWEYVDENDKDFELEFTLNADNGISFGAKELLFKIHNKVVNSLSKNDYHFFEGLIAVSSDDSSDAKYILNLGN